MTKNLKCRTGLLAACAMAVLGTISASADYHWDNHGVTWMYSLEGTNATVLGAIPSDGDVVIPAKMAGMYPVTAIGEQAFVSCEMTSLEIPPTATNIGDVAFAACTKLERVEIPDSVRSFGAGAFCGCQSLESLTIGSGVETIGDFAFGECQSLESVAIPGNVHTIGGEAFRGCVSLASVSFGEGVAAIGGKAFLDCGELTTATLPASLSQMNDNPFPKCSSLAEIKVAAGNPNFKDEGGVVYTKDMERLVAYPAGKNWGGAYAISSGVKIIGGHAFYGSGLSAVTIPAGVTQIGHHAFSECAQLTSVAIPDSVVQIGISAFYYCFGLETVEMGKGVKTIYDGAFEYCGHLTSMWLPDVTAFGESVFAHCWNLTTLNVPASWMGTTKLDNSGLPDFCQIVYYGQAVQTVVFDANGGQCGTSQKNCEYGTAYGELPAATNGTRPFVGWFTAKSGGEQVTAESVVTDAPTRTLYAHWAKNQTVTFNANGGTCPVSKKGYWTPGTYGTLPVATNGAKPFVGWFTAASGGTQVKSGDATTDATTRTLYAHWAKNQTVTFNANGGTCNVSKRG